MNQLFALAALIFTLAISAGISIALINVNCYSTFCSEGPFTFETRVHITVYYAFLATLVCLLLLRTSTQQISNLHIAHELPLIGKRVTLGGLLTSLAILTVTLCSTIYWLPAHDELWGYKADTLDWASAKLQLTITGVTGHYADILLGLLLIPVSRNSLVGQAFYLHQSTLLFAHKAVSYMFSLSVIVHGVAYMLHANDSSRNDDKARHEAFAIGNPALTVAESKQLSGWSSLTYYVGIAAILPVLIILVTSMPWVRRRHYNPFYFSHVILGTLTIVASCLHASTNFYLLLPGLLLWVADWIRRLFFGEARGLTTKTPAVLEIAENGWVRVSLLPNKAIFGPPLLYYYLNFPSVSKVQTHAFTAVAHPANNGGPVFLIQPEAKEKEWTWKLRALVQRPRATLRLDARVEGPYPVSDANFASATHIVCIVGGSGITGALSLAHWWLETRPANTRFDLIWTARHRETTRLTEWQNLEEVAKTASGFTVTAHVSSENGRLDTGQALRRAFSGRRTGGSGWVYSSGPPALLSATERACVEFQEDHRGKNNEKGWTVQDLSWYMARWEV